MHDAQYVLPIVKWANAAGNYCQRRWLFVSKRVTQPDRCPFCGSERGTWYNGDLAGHLRNGECGEIPAPEVEPPERPNEVSGP